MDNDNRKRAFSEVVSLDAWHKGFTASRRTAELHVDVAFAMGRIGAEAESPVRFRLRLKRAEVVVVVPPTEPARIDKASVSRDAPEAKVKLTDTRRKKNEARVGGKAGAKARTKGVSAGAGAEAAASAARVHDQVVKVTQDLKALAVTQVATADGDYAWIVEPSAAEVLEGRPWDAVKKPRLKVTDTRADRTRGIEPTVRVEIRCRREDLDIRDIVLKDKDWAAIAKDPFGRNKTIAAEALIRTRLFEAGLLTGDISDPFAQIVLCATIAETQ